MTWRRAAELLEEREYEQVALLLRKQQEAVQQTGQMTLVILLAAACQICLTCQQFQTERELHQQALEDAGLRERELRKQLTSIVRALSLDAPLDTLGLDETIAGSPPFLLEEREPETDESKSLLERLRLRLGREPSPPTPEHRLLSTSDTAENDENLAFPPSIEADSQRNAIIDLANVPKTQEVGEKQLPPTPEEEPLEAKPEQELDASFPKAEELAGANQGLLTIMAQLSAANLFDSKGYVDSPTSEPASASTDPDPSDLIVSEPTPSEQRLIESTPTPIEKPSAETADDPTEPGDELLPVAEVQADFPIPVEQAEPEEPAGQEHETRSLAPGDDPIALTQPRSQDMISGSPALVVYCLGVFQVYIDDRLIEDWPSGKGKAIFKYLVTHRDVPIAKEILMELFWPAADPDAARNNLNVAIHGLRKALRNGSGDSAHVLFEDGRYLLNPKIQIWLDSEIFLEYFNKAQDLMRREQNEQATQLLLAAETLYQGEFLAEDRYEDWLLPLRRTLQEVYLDLLERISVYYFKREDYATCISLCRQMIDVEPCLEESHCRLMRCYCKLGQRFLAIRQYHQCAHNLVEQLDLPPSPATTQLYEQVRRHEYP